MTKLNLNHPFKVIIAILFVSGFFLSCSNDFILNKDVKIPEEGWKTENRVSFNVDVIDVNSYYNVSLNVRHKDDYAYSNLFLFLTTKYPSGKQSIDTLECILANKKGEWQGNGVGDILENKIPLKQNMVFKEPGKYTFTFEQGMRISPLQSVMDFGMQIEKTK